MKYTFQEDISIIFSKADKNNSGNLRVEDFKEVIQDICERYPQVELYLKKKQLKNFNALLKGSEEVAEINIEKFKKLLAEVDSQMKNLPATAQVNEYIEIIFSCLYASIPYLMLLLSLLSN